MTPDQADRVEALRRAREVLEARPPEGRWTTPPDTYDLVTVARWILTGEDPWPDDPPEPIQGDAEAGLTTEPAAHAPEVYLP